MRLQESSSYYQSRGDKSVTPQNPEAGLLSPTLNRRQVWFLEEIRKGRRLNSTDLAANWRVTERTAKRDIRGLVQQGFVKFRKNGASGWYEYKR
jgi:Fic family protein